MKKPYYKELPLFHIYDSNLTGSQKLLMTLLLIDDTYDMYTLGCLAKRPTEDVVFDLKELKNIHPIRPSIPFGMLGMDGIGLFVFDLIKLAA